MAWDWLIKEGRTIVGMDIAVIAAYLVFSIGLGLWFTRVKNVGDYFLGGRTVHWSLASLSIVATETSALTVISVPGLAYATGMGFLQLSFGYLAGRILVAIFLLPKYFQGDFETVYQFLGRKFGITSRKTVSVLFHVTRVLADGVRLFATALPLTVMMQWDYRISIIVIAAASIAYTFYGGIRSVIITDAVQLVFYLGAAVAGLLVITAHLNAPFMEILGRIPADLTRIVHDGSGPGGVFGSYNVFSGMVGGAFLSFASHGTDHLIVQRVLSCKDLRSARMAMVSSGVIIIFQFAVFLVLGLFIRELLGGRAFPRSDDVIPYFIVHVIPPGLRGLMLAGIIAAAMSTMSSTINSLSSSTCMDLLELGGRDGYTEERKLSLSRMVSLGWTAVIVAVAIMFNFTSRSLVEIGLSIASVTYGGMMGIFVMGRVFREFDDRAALAGMAAGIAATAAAALGTRLFWLWFVVLGFSVSFAAGVAINYAVVLAKRGRSVIR